MSIFYLDKTHVLLSTEKKSYQLNKLTEREPDIILANMYILNARTPSLIRKETRLKTSHKCTQQMAHHRCSGVV